MSLLRCRFFAELSIFLVWFCVANHTRAQSPVVEVLIGPTGKVPAPNAKSELNTPFAIEFTADHKMIVVEFEGGRVLSWDRENGLEHVAGNGKAGDQDGPALEASFNKLHNHVILPDKRMVFSDNLNHLIRLYDPAAKTVSTIAGTGKQVRAQERAIGREAAFNQPIAVSLIPRAPQADDSSAAVLIADIGNRMIRRLELATGTVTIVAGNGSRGVPDDGMVATEAPLQDPRAAIQNEAGEIFILERSGNALRKVDVAGKIYTIAGTGRAGSADGEARKAEFDGPKHLCFGAAGVIFIADDNNHAIRVYDPRSNTVSTLDLGGYQIRRPHGVCVHEGWLYIADSYQHRVLRRKLENP